MALPHIPEKITVHLGAPGSSVRNVTVPFIDYIKNVASSEIYPTWPDNALRANIYAIVSFALNRVYSEHYRSRGYDFDITGSPSYDQAYVDGRDIFPTISNVTDELFNDYLVKGSQIQPYFSQYCSGTTVTCPGLSQWGTVTLANRGYTPLEILRHYYGKDLGIVRNAPVKGNVPSYTGVLYRLGSSGNEVGMLQRRLNRIARNYPAIPKIPLENGVFNEATRQAVIKFQQIFNLAQDGIVGKSTWYTIMRIYNAVIKIAELQSEGITLADVENIFRTIIRQGDRGTDVKVVQFFLNFISQFNDSMDSVDEDGIFGPKTRNSVVAFQRETGLSPDGIVGPQTSTKLLEVYEGIIATLPDQYLHYPGYFITTGAKGRIVRQLQTYLRKIAQNDPRIPIVTVDGIFGPSTERAVKEFQATEDLPYEGTVGPATWSAIVRRYNEYS